VTVRCFSQISHSGNAGDHCCIKLRLIQT